jgi:hypothetical protein
MSLNNDYAMQIISDQKMQEFRGAVERNRLARIAVGVHQPWWRRLFGAPAHSTGIQPKKQARSPKARSPKARHLSPGVQAHHVSR